MPSIIRPTDFREHEAAPRTSYAWDPATLKRLVPILAGQEVIVVTESGTGHAVQGYIVAIVEGTSRSQYPHIGIGDTPDATTYRLHRVDALGEIVVLSGYSNARWDLHTLISQETGRALKAVRAHIGTDFPAGAPYKGPRRWTLTLTWDGVRAAWGQSVLRDRRWFVDAHGNVRDYA